MSETSIESNHELTQLDAIKEQIPLWDKQLRQLLPTLPHEIEVEIKEVAAEDYTLQKKGGWSYGTSGSTPTPESILLEVDTASEIPISHLTDSARATYFHESFHLARGYSFESVGLGLIDVAIEEGLGTKFEIDTAGSNPLYGHHQDRDTMLATLEEVRRADMEGSKDWQKWKHYDSDSDRYWILYRVGTFIAEEALANSGGMQIQDLVSMSNDQILALSKL